MTDEISQLAKNTPRVRPGRYRRDMTVSCRDCDLIPKCDGAGSIIEHEGQRLQIMHNGLRVIADGYYGPEITEIISGLQGHHEPQEELVFYHVLQKVRAAATMIEIGGYWAYYSLWFKSIQPDTRRAIIVEPVRDRLAVGLKNANLNQLKLEFMEGGIGAESKEHVILLGEGGSTANVPAYTLPEIVERHLTTDR